MQLIDTLDARAGMRRSVRARIPAIAALAVLCIPSVAFAQDPRAAGVVVSGTVYDSIARRRVPGVSVELVNAANPALGRPLTAMSDSSGRYAIDGVVPGRYLAGIFYEGLDTLGLGISARVVEIGAGNQRLDFATPSPRTLVRTICPGVNPDSSGIFIGHVLDTETRSSIDSATVVVEWSEFVLDGVRLHERPRTATGRTATPGWFAFCGLPTDVVLLSRAANGADTSGYVEVEVGPGALRYQRFLIGGASTVPVPVDTLPQAGEPRRAPSVARGQARLSGTILDPAGKPIQNAHALIWGTGLDAQTNDRGAFVLEGLPGGTQTLEIRVIGYIPVRRIVALDPSRPATIEVTLDKAAVILATETVRGKLVYSRHLAEFDQRRRSGFGRYLTSEEIERRPNVRLGELLQGMPGVEVQRYSGGTSVRMRNNATSCTPAVYIDGMRSYGGDFDYLYADEIAGIEVYSRSISRPARYADMSGCGAIIVWTRPRPSKPKRDQ